MLKRCKTLRCPNLHSNKSGYCDECERRYKKYRVSQDYKHSEVNKAYSTYSWTQFAKEYVKKHPTCAICGGKAQVCDHKDMTAEIMLDLNDGKFIRDEAYYQPLCIRCNTLKRKQDKEKTNNYFKNKNELLEK